LFFLTVSLCSCPYSSAYNLDETPNIYVEEALIGSWSTFVKRPNSNREEPLTMTLGKKTDTEYDISFTGYLDDLRRFKLVSSDSIRGTAFMSVIGGKQFLNININSRIYIAELRLESNKLSLLPLSDHFTNKMIFSSQALRTSVEVHYKTRVHPVLDDDFCLRDMVKRN
ncbi:MAG TPA: hypothetical protein VHL77_04165, partial [Ferruginibacter sp.]|nr:hypothetical protein [Ferruginibacter sp.]